MDYVEAFKNLRTNNKWGRKSPHKAVLMLTVIELYEKNVLTDNEIYYDDTLKDTFREVWNRVLPEEPKFHSDACLPFWYLQSDSFWHIVPKRGQEDILSLMRDNNVKPSEAKLYDSVKYAELDDDLYFLMTIPSGRSSLKRALLETYAELSDWQIDRLAESEDNAVDNSVAALSEYESLFSKAKNEEKEKDASSETDSELVRQFQKLNEDLQIVLNLEYFSFLKSHRSEREMFKEICPTVYNLYDHLVNHPVKQGEIAPSFIFTYENFLSDLKIALMSEDGAMELIDCIEKNIDTLHGNSPTVEESEIITTEEEQNEEDTAIVDVKEIEETDDMVYAAFADETSTYENRKGKPWTENEEELIALYFKQGRDIATIAEAAGRTEVSIKMRLAKLGLIEYTYGQDDDTTSMQKGNQVVINLDDFIIENSYIRCCIKNKRGDKVFSAEGKLKCFNKKLYRLNLKKECFTIKDMQYDGSVWIRGDKKIVAYPQSALYIILGDEVRYEDLIQDIVDSQSFSDCKVKVGGIWYDNNGNISNKEPESSSANLLKRTLDDTYTFVPKGKLKKICEVAEESYDFLLIMAVVEFMQFTPQPTIITFDRLACMMIAVAWEIIGEDEEVRLKEKNLLDCIQFLMKESKEGMKEILTWNSSKKEIFNAIKDYPMADVFEDTVDMLTENAPYNVLKAWIKEDDVDEIVRNSNTPSSTCLYAIHPMKRNPYIEVKQGWMRYLYNEHDNLMTYFKRLYTDYFLTSAMRHHTRTCDN